jgi:hypothetical protein
MSSASVIVAALLLAIGLGVGGYFTGDGLVRARYTDRTVTVKGLAERDVPADVAIWPIRFVAADQNLEALYAKLDRDAELVASFLGREGFDANEITLNAPAVTDKEAASYGDTNVRLRYTATQTISVYTNKIAAVRDAARRLVDLGKSGVVIASDDYQARTEFLFSGLNDIKPAMIEEATVTAREVAQKFAADSTSRIGKIRSASQGQFSIEDRDSSTPHIKRVRVVSTIEYYLVD